MGRDFAWLWRAYTASTLGTYLALDAFPLIAILALHAGAAQVSMIAAVGLAVGALLAVPMGPWMESRRKRPLMVNADLLRFAVLATIPAAYALHALTYYHLLAAAIVVAMADIVFVGASGAHLKGLVPGPQLLTANGRFENVLWISAAVGPPLGGALIGAVGPVITTVLNGVSFLLSALGIRMIKAPEPPPPAVRREPGRLTEGWRAILRDPWLRLMLANGVMANSLIMATAPLLLYRMVHELGFTPLAYGLALGISCLGGLLGARLSRPLVRRFGERAILLGFGVARTVWLIGLGFIGTGVAGLALVIAVQFSMITCIAVFNPVFATCRLNRAPDDKVARVLTAWTITSRTGIAALTAGWGVLAAFTSASTAMAVAGGLMLLTSALLPWRRRDWAGTSSIPEDASVHAR
ncbi:MFS transporter [Kibdelosporangium phytohabitans]|uniref:MFS transporter n=1 Tax=Kibdelosporangium phytohabitans TaxID=860235 RepID=A0A0N9I688_9PSEU|nr:MFS transporter [Kibdelosporangium phytohabitans]ALG10249.1 MFS transporter [Kibdelosporangium phytohabitans]MBE1461275.1 putative MFS family arabinose efflux permease [Kibdelosporangium phytohabitans]